MGKNTQCDSSIQALGGTLPWGTPWLEATWTLLEADEILPDFVWLEHAADAKPKISLAIGGCKRPHPLIPLRDAI